jgi:hypothetical protein
VVDGVLHEEPALDAGLAVIDGPVRVWEGVEDTAGPEFKPKSTSLAAERADGPFLLVGKTLIADGPVGERARGTNVHTGAAEPASGLD